MKPCKLRAFFINPEFFMRKIFSVFLIASSTFSQAQDSISHKKIEHELGFNSVLLIKQVISNNPGSSLPQLPYQVIYTMNFNGKYGIRAGLGFDQSSTETQIQGLSSPRVTKIMSGAYRLGVNNNFLTFKKLTGNAFADLTLEQNSTTTETETGSGSSFSTREKISNHSLSSGLEIGFGVKYSFNKHIALYTEIPLQFAFTKTSETDQQTVTNNGSVIDMHTTVSSSKGTATRIFIPTTLFLNILF